MRQRSRIVAVAGLLAVGLCPALAGAQAAASAAPVVPPPTAPITTMVPEAPVPEPVRVPTPVDTVQTPPPGTTPAPTPYAGPGTPLTAPPGAGTPRPYAAPGAPPVPPVPPVQPGFDFGGTSLSPLPPPPAPIDPAKIRRQPWRGRYWLALRMSITGPVAGVHPAAPSVLALGGGADVGWRIGNVLGLGMGLSGQTHNLRLLESKDLNTGIEGKRTYKGQMLYWDALFARVHLPLKRRFQPYVEAGVGLARLAHAAGGRSYGPQVRAALGLEGWVSNNLTLGFAGTYRLNALNHVPEREGWVIGHAMQGTFELGLHW